MARGLVLAAGDRGEVGPALEAVAAVVLSRWAFGAIGTAIDITGRIGLDPTDQRRSAYGDDFFDTTTVEGLAILATFLGILLSPVGLLLAGRRADTRS